MLMIASINLGLWLMVSCLRFMVYGYLIQSFSGTSDPAARTSPAQPKTSKISKAFRDFISFDHSQLSSFAHARFTIMHLPSQTSSMTVTVNQSNTWLFRIGRQKNLRRSHQSYIEMVCETIATFAEKIILISFAQRY